MQFILESEPLVKYLEAIGQGTGQFSNLRLLTNPAIMKRVILNGFLFIVISIILSMPDACSRCEECYMVDITGTVMGQSKLCGNELDEARANAYWDCP